MEKTSSKKKNEKVTAEKLREYFMADLQKTGKTPLSVFAFSKEYGISEEDFFTHFNSFGALERSIWKTWLEEVISALENDKAYVSYSVREKLLAFCFTWLDVLKTNRSYVLMKWQNADRKDPNPPFLASFKDEYRRFIEDLLLEGKDTKEVAERPFSNQYFKGFWGHFLFITHFWVNDDSNDYEKTDAVVEKSVHFAFDLIGKGPLDSFIDFAKFLFQNSQTNS
jgi:hypothetical protein